MENKEHLCTMEVVQRKKYYAQQNELMHFCLTTEKHLKLPPLLSGIAQTSLSVDIATLYTFLHCQSKPREKSLFASKLSPS
jgi:hypothetical protein